MGGTVCNPETWWKDRKKIIHEIEVDAAETRFWKSLDGRVISHRQMDTDHIKKCIIHLKERLKTASPELKLFRADVKETIRQFKNELRVRGEA